MSNRKVRTDSDLWDITIHLTKQAPQYATEEHQQSLWRALHARQEQEGGLSDKDIEEVRDHFLVWRAPPIRRRLDNQKEASDLAEGRRVMFWYMMEIAADLGIISDEVARPENFTVFANAFGRGYEAAVVALGLDQNTYEFDGSQDEFRGIFESHIFDAFAAAVVTLKDNVDSEPTTSEPTSTAANEAPKEGSQPRTIIDMLDDDLEDQVRQDIYLYLMLEILKARGNTYEKAYKQLSTNDSWKRRFKNRWKDYLPDKETIERIALDGDKFRQMRKRYDSAKKPKDP